MEGPDRWPGNVKWVEEWQDEQGVFWNGKIPGQMTAPGGVGEDSGHAHRMPRLWQFPVLGLQQKESEGRVAGVSRKE